MLSCAYPFAVPLERSQLCCHGWANIMRAEAWYEGPSAPSVAGGATGITKVCVGMLLWGLRFPWHIPAKKDRG